MTAIALGLIAWRTQPPILVVALGALVVCSIACALIDATVQRVPNVVRGRPA
jgi:uncharacterized integral membrane protein